MSPACFVELGVENGLNHTCVVWVCIILVCSHFHPSDLLGGGTDNSRAHLDGNISQYNSTSVSGIITFSGLNAVSLVVNNCCNVSSLFYSSRGCSIGNMDEVVTISILENTTVGVFSVPGMYIRSVVSCPM